MGTLHSPCLCSTSSSDVQGEPDRHAGQTPPESPTRSSAQGCRNEQSGCQWRCSRALASRLHRSPRSGDRFAACSGAHALVPSRTQPLAARATPVSTGRLRPTRSGGRPGQEPSARCAFVARSGSRRRVGASPAIGS
jgi:hypothetical protein